ncbi:helix-turn-helix domain-containing protein (plasmid) [Arthrobacter sp. G.S.26]|uniref:helix-turn-helix domain-containing protein n=1 Tax=Arthrobacter sp. G.S.26 TaxID=3433706 RepID=UPI003D77450C
MTRGKVEDKYLTVSDVADRIGVSKMTIYRMVRQRSLVSLRIGKLIRIPEEEVINLLAKAKTLPAETSDGQPTI